MFRRILQKHINLSIYLLHNYLLYINIMSFNYEYYLNDNDDSYTWLYDTNRVDKIGISNDGNKIIHDSMVFTLEKFRRIEKKISDVNTIQLVYKLFTWVTPTERSYFTDLTLHEKGQYIAFKYAENSEGQMRFAHITFNGKNFRY